MNCTRFNNQIMTENSKHTLIIKTQSLAEQNSNNCDDDSESEGDHVVW
jgi:hypothetical protein